MSFERVSGEIKYQGEIVTLGIERYRHDDGKEVTREKVWHPGAVGIVAVDERDVWLVRQPREVVGESASLEIPAGKLDVPGEAPLETAKRELAEEIGQRADHWEEISAFYVSPGFSDERVRLYFATGLSEAPDAQPDEHERIEVVRWSLERLEEAIVQCEDAKSLIGLFWLCRRAPDGRR